MSTRCLACVVVVAACGADGPAIDPATTCTVRVERAFGVEEHVYELEAPGRPVNQTWLRDGVVQSTWTYTRDDAGRLVAEAQDCCGGTPAGPDGVIDSEVHYAHAGSSTITSYLRPGDAAPDERIETTVDALDRITRVTSFPSGAFPMTTTDFVVNDDGTVARSMLDGFDIDLGPYTREETFRYEAGRLVEHTTDDSRNGAVSQRTLVYDEQPGLLDVTRTSATGIGSLTTYTYDGAGRPSRIEADEDLDGQLDVFSDFAYDGDAVTATLARTTSSSPRTYTYSSACAFRPAAPVMPTSGTRPGTTWRPTDYPFLLSPLE